MRDHMNVVLNFHKGDQMSAKLLLELLLVVDEGIDCTYYLQYGDSTSTIKISDTLTKFLSRKNAHFSNELPNITIPQEMISNDPNSLKYEGNHRIRSTTFKMSMLGWNLCVFKYIYALDSFLMIEPDCCILKQNWLREIYEDYRNYSGPIFGHLKRGKIRGEYMPTHWAGCSIYNSEELRNLPLERYFYERYENPWWRYRNEKDTEMANNCFLGPAFSGYDITYDYFLFGLYWREKTGTNDPFHWPINDIEDEQHLIFCDFKTKLSADEIFDKFADRLPLMHGIKSDEIRHRMIKHFSMRGSVDRSLPLSGPEDSPIPKSNDVSLNIGDLKNIFSGRRCFIIGNGPSLRKTDMRLLKDEYTIGTNRIYLNYENMGFEPTFYGSVNPNVLEQFAEEIDCVNSVKFVRSESRKYLKNTWNTFFIDSIPTIGFNENFESLSWHEGWTVTFCAMQVAFYLGFGTVILVGVDHYFKEAGEPNKLVTAKGDDPNHFHPSYFGKDIKWQYPDMKRSEQSYRIAKEVFEKDGRRILDATIGGKLQVFPKVDYLSLFDKQERGSGSGVSAVERESPIVSIIMPVLNAATFIGKAVESVQTQSFTEWELIIIDDGSTDNSREIVQSIMTKDSRIRLLGSAGKGVSDARNTGLDTARGELITFLDADDSMYPDALKRRVEALERHHDWNLVHCVTEIVDANSKKLGWQLGRQKEVSFKDMSGNSCHINSLLARAEVFKSARFETGLCGEDWLFLSDILRSGEVSHRVDNCSVAYVIRRDSTVLGDYLRYQNEVLKVLDMIYSPVRKNLPAAPEFAQGLSWPPKETIALYRRIGCLTWLLLEQRANDVAAVLSEFSAQALSALSRGEIRNQIIYPAMRFYACRQEELPARLHKDKASILRLISQTGIEKTFPQYADEFKSLMGKASTNELESMQVSDNIVGPFQRSAHAHIDESALIAALLVGQTKTGVMIDVGAMGGDTLSRFYHAGWRVFAFEPDPTNRKELEIRFGHNPNLTIDGRAVADRIAENMPFYSSPESLGISSLHPFHKNHKETCTVSTTTIADFVREKDLHYIDYLKIDAEGYDLLILKGVPWDIIKPNVILCEFEDSKTRSLGYTMHDMARYLTERGYKVLVSEWHPVIHYGIRHDWHRLVPYPCELNDPNAWGNLVAFRDQPDLQEIATIARRIVKVDKIAPRGGARLTSLRDRELYQRLVGYLKIHYPPIITIGRFVKWSLATLKNTLLGVGGIAVLVTAGLYIAGALIEPARWYLVGIASALLLLCGGLLVLFYARFILNRFISDQRQAIQSVRDQSIRDRAQLQATLDELKKTLAGLKKEISDSKDTMAKMNVGNFSLFQGFNRRLTKEDLKHFAGEWAPKLGLDLDARALAYIAHRICLAEDTCVGRLGGHIETMLLRVMVARSVKEPNLEVLEIGTLFGIGVAMIHEYCRGFFNNVHITVIDPLSGYYGRDNLDVIIKMPVTRDIFVGNMQRMNIPEADYTIIEKLSTEDEAIEQASKRRYNVLIIDGDHSYSGVKHDFDNYRHLVKRGGYIVFDDYNKPDWPEVKDFVDKEVVGLPELEFVGADVYTAVFRAISTQDSVRP